MGNLILTESNLQEKLKYWQERLRLRDWDITAKIVPLSKMDHRDEAGKCEWNLESRFALIYVLSLDDYQNVGSPMAYDMEQTLVHELLHLHFAPMDDDKYYMPIEQAIESISKALVEESRSK
ncbi:hypothetical protein NIE88_04865 [Sporolactobacillus shoreicorticis]|uniref:Uncharacterized protein n=1 Tax=Sporolactobacillus shoreicorticis TaxID=1923877 RepID=A0ABW5RZ40_9BACL|nr:hypothetical protein [Sporolactobacillus shoreicorticis]MCO7125105.1 hypothetical protein [Sporolactobacillus shoreicorticis]